jgi:HlyD family secretion protein
MDVLNSNMDVAKVRKKRRWWQQRPAIVGTAVLSIVIAAVLVSGLFTTIERKVARNQVILATVQRGDLQVTVDGYGVLRSNEQALITALTSATVQEILLRPGARVTKDSLILRLSNPDLQQQLDAARIAVRQEQADLRRLVQTDERDLLAEQMALSKVHSDYEIQKTRNELQKDLAAQGVVPRLDYAEGVENEALLKEQLELERKRVVQFKLAAHESEAVQQEKINDARSTYDAVKKRADRLTVRAGIDGVLQRLPVDLGQSVNAGDQLALVGSEQNLLALVRISQAKADTLRIGQPAEIDTHRERVAGVVTRVAPEVTDGTIEVEIRFKDGVPASARPELNIDARVFTARLRDVLYVERPTNALAGGTGTLFFLRPDGRNAERREVRFAEESGRYIRLVSGAKQGDEVIISDMSSFGNAKRIALVD